MPVRTAVALFVLWSAAPENGAWKPLFNGKDLSGWEMVGPGSFVVENGMLKTQGGMGLLWYTREKFGDCTLRVVFRSEGRGNSGVFIRIPEPPKDPWYAVHHGYEVQIEDGGDEYHRTGVLYSINRALAQPPPGPDGWTTMDITMDGQRTVVTVNGVKVTDFHGRNDAVPERKQWYEPERGPRPDSGYVGLQNHDAETTVWFREVSVRPLGSSAAGFHDWNKVPIEKMPDGLTRQILYGRNVMMVRVVFPPRAAPPAHSHPHEQWTMVEKGPITFRVGDEEKVLQPGEIVYVPSNVMHGATSGPGGAVLVDVFSPIREDFLK